MLCLQILPLPGTSSLAKDIRLLSCLGPARMLSNLLVSSSLWLCGLQPTRLPCLWNSPGKNTEVGCCALLQGIFPTQGLNSHLSTSSALASGFFTTSAIWESPCLLILESNCFSCASADINETASLWGEQMQRCFKWLIIMIFASQKTSNAYWAGHFTLSVLILTIPWQNKC